MTIWANLIHISYNFWSDTPEPRRVSAYRDTMQFDDALWIELTQHMADSGLNMAVLDLGDAVQYRSHPEIALKDAWTIGRLEEELARLRELGLEPVPKLNFSTSHDAWLGIYHRQVSTPAYYQVCQDLIEEVSELFGTPRFFHIGMDEETAVNQPRSRFVVVRQHELWWEDLAFFEDVVTRSGSRPWVWSDYAWRHPQDFYWRMSRSTVQSNWHYDLNFTDENEADRPRKMEVEVRDWRYLTYLDLDDQGFEQIPTASNYRQAKSFEATVEFCRHRLDPSRVLGFLQTTWKPTVADFRAHHLQAIDQVARVISADGENGGPR
ncbi:family 20 glycosylhydrolase [Phytoactinopolyspora mesophila]|uniref:Family 20 glycosylhydrolase n=1 Tax=Phytoactinopolyspora mesophila TaxID=2650750 RepID=A0A7K3M4J1_9ACTN|nr:family 20 glycosylhydrolase [Phytoactinopolyspora mesophila]NDL58229.1 family 20 glycosylhydrolase [Phytoactinopolyspora mesophila]